MADKMETEIYYGTVEINPRILSVVKVIKGNVLDTRMIQVSLWRNFMKNGDWKNAVISISHSTSSYYKKEQLGNGCDEIKFNEIYKKSIQQF